MPCVYILTDTTQYKKCNLNTYCENVYRYCDKHIVLLGNRQSLLLNDKEIKRYVELVITRKLL